ncbi:heavy metal-associated isoprenylated plant protein 7-like [Gastrolobium bilobum]|uniref:heavy metal-associated isoprenylated plant protein 7-like n=1 Tax=Gastrolobium bilobum TaxID=150636 RepID=UPI002AAFBC92|nr:heavy metal-associated isoprenylated plant protein 7-like [Gastrolobium bilobum]
MGEVEKKSEQTKVEEEEEEKKPEETKKEEEVKKEEAKPVEEKKPEESKDVKDGKESKAEAAVPPEIVLKVFMHCEGCARKVRRSLKGLPGVEDVITDCKSHKVVVKGEKADPVKVLERVQRKSHRPVELLSPIPKPTEEKKLQEEEKPKPEEKKEEPQIVTVVVLKVNMHCEACAQEIKRRILRMKGVESAEPDMKNSVVTVKGVYDPKMLVEYVYKRTGKQAVILKQEPEKNEKVKEDKEEKKGEEEKEKEKENKEKKSEGEENKEKKEAEGEAKQEEEVTIEETMVAEVKKNEYQYYPQRNGMEMYAYPASYQAYPASYQVYQEYPPQIFSDENPNACTVM